RRRQPREPANRGLPRSRRPQPLLRVRGPGRPGEVRARIARREDTDGDDAVVVYLDTFRDRERAYMFMTNPLGVQLDGIFTEGQDEDLSFDAVWQSEGRLTADGYVVRIVIPFRSLRFPRAPTQTWGVALGRIIRP